MSLLLISFFLLYIALVIALIVGWYKAVNRNYAGSPSKVNEPFISIIVPVRNEGKNIGNLIQDLSRLRYSHFQVIMVDDHSEDDTIKIINHCVGRDDRFELKLSRGVGKKEALTEGIGLATGSIIVTTDADCRVNENWISSLYQHFLDENVKMVFGGVKMEGKTFFAEVQAMEFMSLIGAGAATAALGMPTMCNGANLAFRKSAFESVSGYEGNFHIPSGDDEFLMKKMINRYPGGVTFANHPQSVVTTSPNADLGQFINQRIRWAGKWKHHQSTTSKALAVFVLCFQIATIFLPLGIVLQWISLKDGLLVWALKIFLEYIFVLMVSRFLHVSWSWRAFAVLQLIYPFYTTIIGLTSNVFSFEWKGRKLKSLMVSNN